MFVCEITDLNIYFLLYISFNDYKKHLLPTFILSPFLRWHFLIQDPDWVFVASFRGKLWHQVPSWGALHLIRVSSTLRDIVGTTYSWFRNQKSDTENLFLILDICVVTNN